MRRFCVFIALFAIAVTVPNARATIVDFTGGTAYTNAGGSVVTENSLLQDNIDYYEENGFKLDFIGGDGLGEEFSAHVGNYYPTNNDVIHSHWNSGNGQYGTITLIEGTQIAPGTFDLNYFILTSNTEYGGDAASGNEEAWIHAWNGATLLDSVLLSSEDWGFPATQIFLPSTFDAITKFTVDVANPVDCFGMDEFYINEAAPPNENIPEPSTLVIWSLLGLVGAVIGYRRRR